MEGMDGCSSDTRFTFPGSVGKSQKRLLFDRRYGWVFDEWKDPAEEAFTGGRGMFCVVPVVKLLLNMACWLVNRSVESATKTVENWEHISPLRLSSTPISLFQNFFKFTRVRNVNLPAISMDRICTNLKPSS